MVTLSRRACCSLQFITGSIVKKTATAKKHSSKNQTPTSRPNPGRGIDQWGEKQVRKGGLPPLSQQGGQAPLPDLFFILFFVDDFSFGLGTVHSQSETQTNAGEYRGTVSELRDAGR